MLVDLAEKNTEARDHIWHSLRLWYLVERHAKGKVIITVEHDNKA